MLIISLHPERGGISLSPSTSHFCLNIAFAVVQPSRCERLNLPGEVERQQHLLEVARATALKTLVFPQNVLAPPAVEKAAAGLLSLFV